MVRKIVRKYFQVHFQFISQYRPKYATFFGQSSRSTYGISTISALHLGSRADLALNREKCAQERLNPHKMLSRAHEPRLTDEKSALQARQSRLSLALSPVEREVRPALLDRLSELPRPISGAIQLSKG
jgi:hypothetical protein